MSSARNRTMDFQNETTDNSDHQRGQEINQRVGEDRRLEKAVEEAIFWANRAKDFERYEISDYVFAVLLSLFENNEEKIRDSRIRVGVAVREERRKSSKLSNGYRNLAWIEVGSRELCIPIPKLARKYACWFYAHASRREGKEGERKTREGTEEEVETVSKEAGRAIEEIKSRGKVTNPDHYLS